MSDKNKAKDVIDWIRAVVVSEKGGIPTQCLRDTYKSLVGEDIPTTSIGYRSVYHLLRDIPEIRGGRNERGEPVLIASSSKTKHLEELIRKQKPSVPAVERTVSRRRAKPYDLPSGQVKKAQAGSLASSNCDPPPTRSFDGRSAENWTPVSFNPTKTSTFYGRDCENPTLFNSNPPKASSPHGRSFELSASSNSNPKPVSSFHEHREVRPIQISDTTKRKRIFGPIVKDRQLVGDDFFLQLCIRYLNDPLSRKNDRSGIRCGTVISGQTISQFVKHLKELKNMSNKIIICLGTEDVYRRKRVEEMKSDFQEMLQILHDKFGYSKRQISVCTLPPLANVHLADERLKTFVQFNKFVRSELGSQCEVIDLYQHFVSGKSSTDFDLFQEQARLVSGTTSPYVLWNLKGRKLAMQLLSE